MRFALASLLLLSAGAARAESRYQLQVGLTGGTYFAGQPFIVLSPMVSIGFEDGPSVWLLGLSGYVSRAQDLVITQPLSDGTVRYTTAETTGVSISLEPGYRRYLADFESGFAPLVEGSLQIGAAHYSNSNLNLTYTWLLGLAATAGFGGEARFGDHFAVDARVFARLVGTRTSGGGGAPMLYGANLGLGTSAGLTLRF